MYGYWSHCLYSCDPKEYDHYVKSSSKKLPMIEVDEFFNEKNSDNFYHGKSIHSESDLNKIDNLSKQKEENSKLSSKKSEPAFNSAFLKASEDLDLIELWKVQPRPSYTADVKFLIKIKKNLIICISIFILIILP